LKIINPLPIHVIANTSLQEKFEKVYSMCSLWCILKPYLLVFYYNTNFYWEFFREKAETTSNDCKLNFTWTLCEKMSLKGYYLFFYYWIEEPNFWWENEKSKTLSYFKQMVS